MKKLAALLCCTFLSAAVFAGVSAEEAENKETITLTDNAGREVELPYLRAWWRTATTAN